METMITPLANRGLNSQNVHHDTNSTDNRFTVGIDWIQGTSPNATAEQVIALADFVEASCKEKFVWNPGVSYSKGMTWENYAQGAEKSLLTWTEPKNGEPGHLWLSLNARVVARIGDTLQRCKFIKILIEEFNFTMSRLDIAIDDYEKELKFDTIWQALKDGNFSGFRNWQPIPSGSKPGWTIYLGSREADKFVRIYDKTAESKGEIDAIRWETVYKDKYAEELGKQICNLDFSKRDTWIGGELAGMAMGRVNFIEKSEKNLNRCKMLDWFESFRSALCSPIKLQVQRIKPTIDSTIKWLERSVSASLKMICSVKNENFIDKLLKLGESKLGSRHYALMETSKMQFEVT